MPKNLQKAREIFLYAVGALPSPQWEAYLTEACGDDAELFLQVQNLLQVHREAGSFLNAPAPGLEAVLEETSAEYLGSSIGPYKLLQLLGEGGMGVVYMAEQSSPVERRVALKIIKPGMDTRQVLARFEAERQAIAVMDHPNIAKALDAGKTESGRPYFAMELVKGPTITQYCDEKQLTLRQRLELLVPVCQAIQHAHQKGIIHRDIKPTNILVSEIDGRPIPKVIDFGVAKAMCQPLTENSMVTSLGQIVGTLEYMSPEQARVNQIDIDTRSDIYSLGVLMYELLTGCTPFDKKRLRTAAFDEMLRIIREDEPEKPSMKLSGNDILPAVAANRRVEPGRLGRTIEGELDWIVMKALEKNRTRRYETATGLASDIQRYLNDEPVQACPPSARYRLGKFARKNRAAISTAAFVGVALFIGAVVSTWQAVRATLAEKEARANEVLARKAAESERSAKQAETIQRQRAEASEKTAIASTELEKKSKETALAREAETQAVLAFVEARIFEPARPIGQEGGLGREVTLKKALASALPFVEKSFPDQPLVEARVRMTIGTSFWYLGDIQIATDQFEAASRLYTVHLGPDHLRTLTCKSQLAAGYASLGRHIEALQLRKEIFAARKTQLGPNDISTLSSAHSLGVSYFHLRRLPEALQLQEETLASLMAQVGPEHINTINCSENLGNIYAALGRFAESLTLREEVLVRKKEILSIDDPATLGSMENLAQSYASLGRKAEALKLDEETLNQRKRILGADHPDTFVSTIAVAAHYVDLGRHVEALQLREEALAQITTKLGPDHHYTLMGMAAVAESLVELDRSSEALLIIDECLRRVAAKKEKVLDQSVISSLHFNRIRSFAKKKDAAGCREATEMWEKLKCTGANDLYNSACMRAICAAVIRAGNVQEFDAKEAESEADRAMAWLHQAVAAGYQNAAHIKQDQDLIALRDREDFKKLLSEFPMPP